LSGEQTGFKKLNHLVYLNLINHKLIKMKYFLLSISLIIFLSCESPQKESPNDLTKEIISVVYMIINNKSDSQIDDFSYYYKSK